MADNMPADPVTELAADDDVLGPGVTVVHLQDGDVLFAGSDASLLQRAEDCRRLLDVYGGGALVVMPTPDRHVVLRPHENPGAER